ncbi:MFS transporter [Gammaproteobacteria bacterium]|jgi:MFS family permease|nr:MFS transporter [Gammaproteobacteria bacterium]
MATAEEEQHNAAAYPRPAYAWYVVVLMMFFYVLSFMDRQIIAVLIDPIKADLSLSDVQISLIGGVSFGLFYSLVGIFIGRLADSMNRPLLIALGVFIWSLTTALSGLASKFWQLLVLRMGVGLGEAALLPSTLSLLTNYFPPKRLATPTSVFLLGAPIGIGLSFAAGGYLFDVAQDIVAADGWNDVIVIGGSAAWKLVLIFLGVVGMIMTFAMVTVREPRTTGAVAAAKPEEHALKASEAAKLSDVKIYARQHWLAIAGLYVCMALVSLAAYSQAFWDIAFLSRSYDRDPSSVTFMYGMVQMFAGLSGMLSGGILADRLTRRGVQGSSVIMVMIGCAISVPFSFMYPLMGTASSALWLMVFAIFGSNMAFACAASAMQRMFPVAMLGLAAGIYYFLSNSVGLLIGPTLVASLTDYVFADSDKVGYSLSAVGGTARLLAFIVMLAGFKAYRDLLREREQTSA